MVDTATAYQAVVRLAAGLKAKGETPEQLDAQAAEADRMGMDSKADWCRLVAAVMREQQQLGG